MKKTLFLIIFFYILILLESSFLLHFTTFNFIPNLILITVILISFFDKSQGILGIYSAILGGFFLDVFGSGFFGISFGSNFFGFSILFLLIVSIFIELIFKRYVQFPRRAYG